MKKNIYKRKWKGYVCIKDGDKTVKLYSSLKALEKGIYKVYEGTGDNEMVGYLEIKGMGPKIIDFIESTYELNNKEHKPEDFGSRWGRRISRDEFLFFYWAQIKGRNGRMEKLEINPFRDL